MCKACEERCVRDGGERECVLTDLEWSYEMGDITLAEYLKAIGYRPATAETRDAGK